QMVLRSLSFVREEVERTDALIRDAGWEGTIYFRPPYGKRLFVLPRYLDRTGRKTVLWDIEPESYGDAARTAERMTDHVVDRAVPGSIILLHVMYSSNSESRRALPLIVGRLKDQGYRFVTIAELFDESADAG
ncbi:MAG: polysaccharide deacetylase, partial [Rhodothermales bacterium]|nr:polysaccharide deacetylase [Rhodothermales bacterium]